MRQRNLKTKTGQTKTKTKRPGECLDSILAFDDITSDHIMTRVTLARVNGSHCGQNTYVSVGGREVGSLHRGNPEPDGPEKRWKAQYTAAANPRSLGVFLTERSGVRRIAEHHHSHSQEEAVHAA